MTFGKDSSAPDDTPSTIGDVPASSSTSRDLRRIAKKLREVLAERDALIAKAKDEGASLRDIGADLGVNHVTVRNLLAKIDHDNMIVMTHQEHLEHGRRTGIDEDTTRF